MFEYNNVLYTTADMYGHAQALGLSLDDYLAAHPEIKERTDLKEFIPENKRVNFEMLESSLIEQGILIPGENTANQNFLRPNAPYVDVSGTVIEPKPPTALSNISRKAKKTNLQVLTPEQKKSYNDYLELYKEAVFEERMNNARAISESKGDSFGSKMINAIDNMFLQIAQAYPNTQISGLQFARQLFGSEGGSNVDDYVKDLSPNFFERMLPPSIGLMGPGARVGKRFIGDILPEEVKKYGLKKANKELIKQIQSAQIIEARMGQTGSITEGWKQGDLGEIVAGATNAVGSFGASAFISYATRGAGIYTDFFGRAYENINQAKADELGISLEQLIITGQDDVRAPIVTAGAAGLLERFGIKGVTKALRAKPPSYTRALALRASSGTREGLTEYFQHGIEQVETAYGKGVRGVELGEVFVNSLNTQEGLESFLQGFVGGGIISSGGNLQKRDAAALAGIAGLATFGADGFVLAGSVLPLNAKLAAFNMRSAANKKKMKGLEEKIHVLKEQLAKTTDKDGQDIIIESIEAAQNEIKKIIKADNVLINQLSEEDMNSLAKFKDLNKEFQNKFKKLSEKREKGEITLSEYNTQKALLGEQLAEQQKELKQIVSDVSLKNQNISQKNADLIKIIKDPNADPAAIQKAKNDLVENNKGFIEKLIKSTFNPTLKSGLSEQDYRAAINLEFAKIINSYKIKENVPFGAYLQQNLPKRLPAIFDLAIETNEEGDFIVKTDVTESDVTAYDQLVTGDQGININTKSNNDLANNIIGITGLNKEESNTKGKEILSGKLPGVTEKVKGDQNPFLTAIEKAAEGKFFQAIMDAMGGNFKQNPDALSEYVTFLETNIADIKAVIEEAGNQDYNRYKNKMLKSLYKPKKIGRAKAAEGGTAVGEGRYEYQTPTDAEIISYFSEGNLTTVVERKKTLSKILSHSVGKQAVAEAIKDPAVAEKFKGIQELLGKEVPANVESQVIAKLDRIIKKLEDAKSDPNVLRADFGVGAVVELGRRSFLRFFKSIRQFLKDGANFNKAKSESIKIAARDLNLSKNQEQIFTRELGPLSAEIIDSNELEVIYLAAIRETVKERYKEDSKRIIKTIKEKLNDKKLSPEAKADVIFEFFKYEHSSYVKSSASHGLWEGASNDVSFKYWEKQFGIKLKTLGFEIKDNSIFHKDKDGKLKKVTEYVGRPSGHTKKSGRKKDRAKLIQYYEKNIEKMDAQAELHKVWYVNKLADILLNEGKQAALDFISISGLASDGSLRLIGKLRYVEKAEGPFTYEHTPPINDLQQDMYEAINSSNNISEILGNVDNILSNSRVDFISDATMEKVNAVNKITGKDVTRYKPGNLTKKGLQELKRPKQKVQESTQEQDLNGEFNKIVEQSTGIKAESRFKGVKGRRGDVKRRFRLSSIFIPYTAEDLNGLMYAVLPKGEAGNKAYKWIKEHIYKPFSRANENIIRDRMATMNDYDALKKQMPNVVKKLKEKTDASKPFFTKRDAVRVWIWNQQNMEIPELSQSDKNSLLQTVNNDPELIQFAQKLIGITKEGGYGEPNPAWDSGTITTDLQENINVNKRAKYLEQWQNNVDTIFDEAMYNKLRAAYGDSYVRSLKNILTRMKLGRNRTGGGNPQIDAWLDWLNNSVGAIMFVNVRSAVLQTISTVNYMNWHDNNPLKAAKAFANQKQFWSDFSMIFNSDYLKARRGGLQLNVQESEIAEQAKKKGVRGVISYLLNKGFILTRAADSFAIANGGAAMYRNRVNTYLKQGKTQQQAEQDAFSDFIELTEEAQQSSRPDRISMEQAGPQGRVILAFANTPMQYTRLMKRSVQDLVNKRGDAKTNMSKLIYYGAVQNFIFNAMQQALFALGYDDEEEEEKIKEKYQTTANSMLDSILRGTGMVGNAVMVAKNFAIDIAKRSRKPKPNFDDAAWKLLDISPPLDSKVTKVRSALYSLEYNEFDEMAMAQTVSAFTNVPADRVIRLYQSVRAAVAEDTEAWQRVALLLGWNTWELGIKPEDDINISNGGRLSRRSNTRSSKRRNTR